VSSEVFAFKQIKPKRFEDKAFKDAIHKELWQVGKEIMADYNKTIRFWKHKPKFHVLHQVTPPGPTVLVGTDDPQYGYVDLGTKVRYATMSPDFKAKTTVNVLESKKGKGGLLFVSKKHPRPRIKARNFSKNIQKAWNLKFKQRMERAMKAGAAGSGQKA
jgi:hypothetical protein